MSQEMSAARSQQHEHARDVMNKVRTTTIRHIVLLRFKALLSAEEIHAIFSALGKLQNDIPQIASYSWGPNNSPENLDRGYSHGFIMEFKNEEDRKIYLEHPQHIAVAKNIVLPALENGIHTPLVFDYEVFHP